MDSNKYYMAFCNALCRNFDKSWDQVGAKLDFAYQYLKHIPDECFRQMVPMAMQRWERWPTNWAKAVLSLYRDTQRDFSAVIAYDPVEDFRFPIGLMQKSFDILMEDGYPAFLRYAKAVKMPQNDQDRVEMKARVCRSGEDATGNVKKLISQVFTGESQR